VPAYPERKLPGATANSGGERLPADIWNVRMLLREIRERGYNDRYTCSPRGAPL
jgi:hypothetical protein